MRIDVPFNLFRASTVKRSLISWLQLDWIEVAFSRWRQVEHWKRVSRRFNYIRPSHSNIITPSPPPGPPPGPPAPPSGLLVTMATLLFINHGHNSVYVKSIWLVASNLDSFKTSSVFDWRFDSIECQCALSTALSSWWLFRWRGAVRVQDC